MRETDTCKYPFKVIHYELGIPCRFHDFRDTHATRLIESGADIKTVSEDMPAYAAGLKEGDKILKLNDKKIPSNNVFMLELQINSGKDINLEVERNGEIHSISISPKKVIEDKKEVYRYGFVITDEVKTGFLAAIKFSICKTISLLYQMVLTIFYLVTGSLGLKSLSGPVGIYSIVGQAASSGFWSLVSLTALL